MGELRHVPGARRHVAAPSRWRRWSTWPEWARLPGLAAAYAVGFQGLAWLSVWSGRAR